MHFGAITADRPLLLVGAGNMGRALLEGWRTGGLAPNACVVVDPVAAIDGMICHAHVPAGLAPGVIVLAVKPQVVDALLPALADMLCDDTLVLSIIAGKTLAHLRKHLGGHVALVRAMPNLPSTIGQGITALCADADVPAPAKEFATALMSAVGQALWLEKETQINAVTALSGSGPAYVFHLIECMASAGVQLGLPEAVARTLAIETVAGAGALARASDADLAVLRQRVTSPGGTTQAGLDVLMAPDGLASLVRHAMEAAAKRAKELGS